MTNWRDHLDPSAPPGDYLPWKVVAKRTSLSRTTAWRLQRLDDFPRPYAISPGRVGYREDEVEAWRASRGASAARPKAERLPAPTGVGEPAEASTPAEARRGAVAAASSSAPPAGGTAGPSPSPAKSASGPRRRRSEHARAIAQQITFDF